METLSRIATVAVLLICPCLVMQGLAAQAYVKISLVIPKGVHLKGLQDIDLQWQPARHHFYAQQRACVTLRGRSLYTVRLDSRHGHGSRFVMAHGDSQVPYAVRWNHQRLASGQRSRPIAIATEQASACTDRALLQVETRRKPAAAGAYADTLTIRVQAE